MAPASPLTLPASQATMGFMSTKSTSSTVGDLRSLPRVCTANEAAKALSVSRKTVLRWAESGRLRRLRVGERWRIETASVNALNSEIQRESA